MRDCDILSQMLFFELCDGDEDLGHTENEWECRECGENLLLNESYKV